MRRHDDAGRARSLGAAADGAEVPRVADLVEAREERAARPRRARTRRRTGTARTTRARPGGRACPPPRERSRSSFICTRGRSISRSQGSALTARSVAQSSSTSRRPAQRLAHGAPAVDQLPRHGSGGTSLIAELGHVAHLPAGGGDLVAQPVAPRRSPCASRAPAAAAPRARRAPSAPRRARRASRARRAASPRRSELPTSSPTRQSWKSASASGVLKSSSSAPRTRPRALASRFVARRSSRKTLRNASTCARACASVSSEKSIGLRQCAVRKKSEQRLPPPRRRARRGATRRCRATSTSSRRRSASIPLCVQIARELVAERARLRELVLVVREDEVEPAAVDLEHRPEQLLRHRRALDVPARPAAPPRRVPRTCPRPGLFAFQSAKSRGSSLSGFGSCSSTWSGRWPESRPYSGYARDAEVDVALDRVRVAARRSAPR